jgi:gluconolactonase
MEHDSRIAAPGPYAEYEVMATGLGFPEGPVALPDGSVLVVEIAHGCLTRIDATGRKTVVAKTGGGPNGAALGPDGAVYVCNNGGFAWAHELGILRPANQAADYAGGSIQRVELETGKVSTLYTECNGRRLCGPNDLVFDREGGFYFTDTGKRRPHEVDRGAVYYARADGSHIATVVDPIPFPNGIGLSPDESLLYVAESETGRLWSFDITQPGKLALLPQPSPHGGRYVHGTADYQRYDSLKVEQNGRICIATLVKGGITSVEPDGGQAEFVSFPDRMTTNLCFGGADYRTVYVTLGSTGQLLRMRWPRPGLPLNFNPQVEG